jgi:hypothetical protein
MPKKRVAKPTKFQKLVTSIERTNRSFKKAGQAKRIVMVATDVLAMLSLKRLRPITGRYVILPAGSHRGLKDVSEFLKLPRLPACEVCAIGAAMVASTIRLDHVPITFTAGEVPEMEIDASFHSASTARRLSGNMSARALDVFPRDLLAFMEAAFEHRDFGYNIESDTARLRSIYKNLIKNKGKKFTDRVDGTAVWPE